MKELYLISFHVGLFCRSLLTCFPYRREETNKAKIELGKTRDQVALWRDSIMRVTWLIRVCTGAHACTWHDSFIYVTCLIHIPASTIELGKTRDKVMLWLTLSNVWHDAFVCVPGFIHIRGLIRIWDMTHSYVCCDMTDSYMWHDLLIRLTRFILMCAVTPSQICERPGDMTHSFVRLMCMCTEAHSYLWHDSSMCAIT